MKGSRFNYLDSINCFFPPFLKRKKKKEKEKEKEKEKKERKEKEKRLKSLGITRCGSRWGGWTLKKERNESRDETIFSSFSFFSFFLFLFLFLFTFESWSQ